MKQAYDGEWFVDSYRFKFVLRRDNGEIYSEEYEEMSIHDFEMIYGLQDNEILKIDLELMNYEKIDSDGEL